MKADLPLAERLRIQREQGTALRAALVRRHFDVMEGEQALAGAQLAADLQMSWALSAHLARPRPAVPVVAPEPEAPSAPPTSEQPDLRAQLGLK